VGHRDETPGAVALDGPLAGLTVLDLTQHVAGPYCTKLLGTYGARVVKVERPRTGDPMRHAGPFAGGVPGIDRSLAFLDLNLDKLGVTLDLASATGRRLALELVARSDVVVESFAPRTLDGWGLGRDVLEKARPELVLTSISNFGQTGPYRDLPASEIVLYAMGHEMYGTGLPEREPMSMAPRLNLCFAGQTAAVATMAAVVGRALHGGGDWIDVSIMETFLSSIDRRADSLVAYAYCGEKMVRSTVMGLGLEVPRQYSRCKDGFIYSNAGSSPAMFKLLATAVGEPWIEDERYVPPVTDPAVRDEFESHWIPWATARTKRELVERFQAGGIACAPVNTVADLVDDPQLAARAYFEELEHPVVGKTRHAGLPFRMRDTPGRHTRPAPLLGQHNAEVYGEVGLDEGDLLCLASAGVI
jgi:crotonobetainyl-CoA:carnitine CoA-transferase CaiB-like acyl-CoA transferase